jgi:hypothetical protein
MNMRKIFGIVAAILLIGIAAGGEPTWMEVSAIEQGDGHALHVTLYDADENMVVSDGELYLRYVPMLSGGYGAPDEDELKNETLQVTKSMFKNRVLKLPRIGNLEMESLFRIKSYEVNAYGGGKTTVWPDGVKIYATFTLPSKKRLSDNTEWWQTSFYE